MQLQIELKCFIRRKIKYKDFKEKYPLSEMRNGFKIHQVAKHLPDDVYVKISYLVIYENISSANLFHHHICYTVYIHKYEMSHHYVLKTQHNTPTKK